MRKVFISLTSISLIPMMIIMSTLVLLGCPNAVIPPVDTVIDLGTILGVTAPVVGATPVTAITVTAQYRGTVVWNPAVSGVFAPSTEYTATITLTAKSGYTFTGVEADFFSVAGAISIANPANSGVVTVVFPTTSDGSYVSANIGTLKYVPPGRFQRDGTAGNISEVSAFRMSEHEITRSQFQAVMGADPSFASYSSGIGDPVQQTNWYHAIAFCNKLSLVEGLEPVYSVIVRGTPVDWGTLDYASIPDDSDADWDAVVAKWSANGYRLPTEMEWMWAVMGAPADGQGGGTNTTGYVKAFSGSLGSNVIEDYAVYGYRSGQAGATTTGRSNPVGSKLPNELGLRDMSGNVWEWNWDWYGAYPMGAVTDYRGAVSGTVRIRRGGSWSSNASDCAVAYRRAENPYFGLVILGFRVVRP